MITRPITPAARRKNLAEQEAEFTSEGAPAPTEGALPVAPGRRRSGPNESRVPAGIPGAHRRAPTGQRRAHRIAIAALLAVPLMATAGDRDHDHDHDRDRDDVKHRSHMSFNDLARKDSQDWWHGDSWSSKWKFHDGDDDDDDDHKRSKRWPHEGHDQPASPVPEPGGAALLLAGLAAIGFVVTRRRAG